MQVVLCNGHKMMVAVVIMKLYSARCRCAAYAVHTFCVLLCRAAAVYALKYWVVVLYTFMSFVGLTAV